MIEFLKLENVSPQQIHNRTTVVGLCVEDAPSYATVSIPNLKKHLRGQRFLNQKELKYAADKRLI